MAEVKPRIEYRDLAWMRVFEMVKSFGAGSIVGDFKIIYIHDDPPWVQVKGKDGKRMIRKGDEFIHQLAKCTE